MKSLRVEKVAGGGKPVLLTPEEFALVFDATNDLTCCHGCCPE